MHWVPIFQYFHFALASIASDSGIEPGHLCVAPPSGQQIVAQDRRVAGPFLTDRKEPIHFNDCCPAQLPGNLPTRWSFPKLPGSARNFGEGTTSGKFPNLRLSQLPGSCHLRSRRFLRARLLPEMLITEPQNRKTLNVKCKS